MSERLNIRLSPNEHNIITRRAQKLGLSNYALMKQLITLYLTNPEIFAIPIPVKIIRAD